MNEIRKIRKLKGLSQNELAKEIGISRVLISKLEADKGNLDKWAQALCKALNCTIAELTGKQEIKIEPDRARYIQGLNCALLRAQRGLSQTVLAKKAGIKKQAIWQLEQGIATVSEDTFNKIAEVLKVTPYYLKHNREEPILEKPIKGPVLISDKENGYDLECFNMAKKLVDIITPYSPLEEAVNSICRVYNYLYENRKNKKGADSKKNIQNPDPNLYIMSNDAINQAMI
jgi:transcriptional regulator with XRE-family HTH domain